MTPPFHYTDFESEALGIDETNNRFGEVSIETCRACGSKWLRYFVEYEAFTASGRWYKGLLPREKVDSVTPESAVEILSSLPWHFYGGSYFETTGRRGTGPISVDL